MKILLHASLDFANEMLQVKQYLEQYKNITVLLPNLTRYQHIRDENGDDITFTKIKNQLIRQNINLVTECDILLILNPTHRNVKNYIGGNSFLEMTLAFYLNKAIYLLNDIPNNMSYTEEIKAFYPKVVYSIDNFLKEVIVNPPSTDDQTAFSE